MKTKLLLAVSIAFGLNAIAQTPPYVPTNGLQGYFPFSGNANDQSGNGNNGTNIGATLTADRFGNINSAYSFDGTTSHISLNDTICNFGVSDFTISAWQLKYDTLVGGAVLGKRNSTGDGNMLILNSHPGYEISTGTGDYMANNMPYQVINIWYHTVFVRTGLNLKTYLNGLLINNVNSSAIHNINNAAITEIGARYSGSAIWNLWNGVIDDIGIWNRALTTTEINDLYNGNICYQYITVTDTLLINTTITGFSPITYQNTIKVWPNPTNDHITIDNGNIANLTGYQIKISNSLGQQVFLSSITQQQFYIDISTWGGNGLYFVNTINAQGVTIDTKKIVLQ